MPPQRRKPRGDLHDDVAGRAEDVRGVQRRARGVRGPRRGRLRA